jgi:hypothetical protein
MSTKAQRALQTWMADLDIHFTPGNIIYNNYWREYDRVISFETAVDGTWSVRVINVIRRADGSWMDAGCERGHSTRPDKRDRIEATI